MNIKSWMLAKGLKWALKEAEKMDLFKLQISPILEKHGLMETKRDLINLFKDWIEELS